MTQKIEQTQWCQLSLSKHRNLLDLVLGSLLCLIQASFSLEFVAIDVKMVLTYTEC